MIPNSINIKGVTKENRNKIIDYTSTSISRCSGWITNHSMYSNTAISISFKVKIKNIEKLINLLNSNGIKLTEKSLKIIDDLPTRMTEEYKNKEIFGSINITFIHSDKDLKIDVPAVPG